MKHTTLASVIIFIFAVQLVCCSRDPKDWKLVRSARADELVTFHVALHQRNTDLLEKHLYEISDPTHPRYGEEMTREQIMSLIAPPKQDHDAVVNWFAAYGADVKIHSFGDALKITAPSHLVEKMLNTRLYKYQHTTKTHMHAIRQVGGFTIPSELSSQIYMITGLTMFPYVRKDLMSRSMESISSANDVLAREKRQSGDDYPFASIANIRTVYKMPAGLAAQNPNTNQVAMEFLPQTAPLFSDVTMFIQMSNEVYTNYSKIIGPFSDRVSVPESTLDVELLTGLGSKVANWYFTISSGWIYEMALELFNLKETPQVVSISYGWPELDSCDSSNVGAKCDGITVAQWVNRTNIELIKVGLRRVSMLSATQDEGAAGPLNSNCFNKAHPIWAIYPSSSPFMTAISATVFTPVSSTDDEKRSTAQDTNNSPICQQPGLPCVSGPVTEWPAMVNNTFNEFTTGGGFSEMTSMPAYQTTVVQKYLNTPNLFLPPTQYFKPGNRGYPDFSTVGSRILIVQNGFGTVGEGTSASTPIAAAMIALLNDARAQVNKKPLGFLNPMLYKMYSDNPATFNDITQGDNHCTFEACCEYGYGATVGWDAVTGLGTPNFMAINKYVTNLP